MIVKDTFQIVKHKVKEIENSKSEKQPRRSNIQFIGRTQNTEKCNTRNKQTTTTRFWKLSWAFAWKGRRGSSTVSEESPSLVNVNSPEMKKWIPKACWGRGRNPNGTVLPEIRGAVLPSESFLVFIFICLWLHGAFTAVCARFSRCIKLGLLSSCVHRLPGWGLPALRSSRCAGFRIVAPRIQSTALAHRLSCSKACGIFPTRDWTQSPVLAGKLLTSGPPGKSLKVCF